jgi:hypothetical protein
MAVPINIGTKAKPVGLTCWSANPAAQQRRPTTRCADVVVIAIHWIATNNWNDCASVMLGELCEQYEYPTRWLV